VNLKKITKTFYKEKEKEKRIAFYKENEKKNCFLLEDFAPHIFFKV
jgi:hypothetical protein